MQGLEGTSVGHLVQPSSIYIDSTIVEKGP